MGRVWGSDRLLIGVLNLLVGVSNLLRGVSLVLATRWSLLQTCQLETDLELFLHRCVFRFIELFPLLNIEKVQLLYVKKTLPIELVL